MILLPFELETCPNECGKECGEKLAKCPTFRMLPEKLQEISKDNLHLLQYLRILAKSDIGIPEYYDVLNRNMKSIKNLAGLLQKEGSSQV